MWGQCRWGIFHFIDTLNILTPLVPLVLALLLPPLVLLALLLVPLVPLVLPLALLVPRLQSY